MISFRQTKKRKTTNNWCYRRLNNTKQERKRHFYSFLHSCQTKLETQKEIPFSCFLFKSLILNDHCVEWRGRSCQEFLLLTLLFTQQVFRWLLLQLQHLFLLWFLHHLFLDFSSSIHHWFLLSFLPVILSPETVLKTKKRRIRRQNTRNGRRRPLFLIMLLLFMLNILPINKDKIW